MKSAANLYLYQREGAYLPRVGAVHDLCGYGTCSLGVAIPVLSAAGCDVCPVPTSLFSAHTLFPVFYMHDTTSMLNEYLDAWQAEGIELDAIYSGFLGAAEQVACIKRLYQEHPHALRIVDPVMGDDGTMFPTYTEELCRATAELVDGADLLLPNLTEASLLTGIPYEGRTISIDLVKRLMDALLTMGARAVVLKGITYDDGLINNCIQSTNTDLETLASELLPYMLCGTGDLFASALLAAVMCGKSLYTAVEFAGTFVRDCMRVTRDQPDYAIRGVSFEGCLGEITHLLSSRQH